MTYYDIQSTFAKVDFSPIATAFLERVMADSDPDAFTQDQRDDAVYLAQIHGDAPYDGRFDEDDEEDFSEIG